MKAILLAAGVGKRLWSVTQHRPKCLIEFGGRSLLDRSLESLSANHVDQVLLVVGYKQDMVRKAVGESLHGLSIQYLVNHEYHRGSISSFWEARRGFDDDVVIMDADVLFHRIVLQRLMSSIHPTALCLDESVTSGGEECMATAVGDRVVTLSKRIPDRYDVIGEGVGFLKVQRKDLDRLVASLEPHVVRGQWHMEYEDALFDFFQTVKVGYERIGGLPWTEIDFPEDVTRAEREVLPKLD